MKAVFVYEYVSAHGTAAWPALAPHEAADLQAQGRTMRDALCADLLNCGLSVGHAVAAEAGDEARAGGMDAASEPLRVAPGEAPEAVLARAAATHERLWLIAPETDGLLERLSATLPASRRVGCGLGALRVASHKSRTAARLAAAGIATPWSLLDNGPATRGSGPGAAGWDEGWIVKPDDGAGTVETRWHARHDVAEADRADREARGASVTLEPYVAGDTLSLSLLCEPGEAELLALNRQQLRRDAQGWLHDEGVQPRAIGLHDLRAPALRTLARQIARALPGLGGYVGVDLVWHPVHGPVVIELNPRLTSAWPGLQQALGRPLAAQCLAVPVDDGAAR